MSDLKFALRQLLKYPGFTTVAILTLALGIGANTATFSVLDKLLVRPLPVQQPQSLALLGQPRREGNVDFDFNYPLFLDYQRQNTVFTQLAATSELDIGLGTGGATERQRAMVVSGNYFSLLGVGAALGRTFAQNEEVEIDDAAVIVLSHGLWQRRFGADPQVIGRSVTVNGRPFTIIGVAPREFTGTSGASLPDLYLPITTYGELTGPLQGGEHPLRTRFFTWLYMIGRLRDGATLEQAGVAMNKLAREIYTIAPANTSTNLVVLPGAQGFTHDLHDARLPLKLLLAISGLVLLIACANLANLQLARATGRVREFAIRLALGAGRARLIRTLLLETVLLALVGGGLGLLIASWLAYFLGRYHPANVDLTTNSGVDSRVLLFTFIASVLTGVLFGLAPALRASRPQLVPELKAGGGTTESSIGRWHLRGVLTVFQVALSLLVLVSAGLCMRSLEKLQRLDPGAEPSRVVLMSLDLGLNNHPLPQANVFYERLLERVRSLPGIEAASLGLTTPLSGRAPGTSVERVEDYQPGPNGYPFSEFNIVASDYFRALGVPLLEGRDFSSSDSANGHPVVIVNEAFVRRYWPGQDALGKRIFQHAPNGGTATEVIGVTQSIPNRALTESPRPALYFPLTQKTDLALTLVVRTGLPPSGTIGLLRELVKSMDSNVPVFNIHTLAQQKDGSLALQRMAATLLSGFGALGLLLAAVGIYGVIAYSVSRRTREIGVRLALGAQLADVLLMVLRQGLYLVALGTVIGLACAFTASRVLRGFLYNVNPADPATFLGVVCVLALTALVACFLPARRATKVDPMQALRYE
jgi:predicted permease